MDKTVDVDGIRAAANRYLKKSGGTASELAAEVGISKGRLSMFLRGVYDGNNVVTAEKLAVVKKRLAMDEVVHGGREVFYIVQYLTKHGLNFARTKNRVTAQTWIESRLGAVGWTLIMDPMGKEEPICWPWAGKSDETNGD
jgi:transcriptional regulator with XRE-family HTH domain